MVVVAGEAVAAAAVGAGQVGFLDGHGLSLLDGEFEVGGEFVEGDVRHVAEAVARDEDVDAGVGAF